MSISHNPVHHDRTKRVEVDRHFIKEKVDQDVLDIQHISIAEQTADTLTKALFRPAFEKVCRHASNVQFAQSSLTKGFSVV